MLLEKINSPEDVKALKEEELPLLAKEVREALLYKLSRHGGHVGPNLGDVELTIALHYVFSSPKDKIVYDVSHQAYTHKILTGRKEAFLDESKFDDVTGFTDYEESPHDFFNIGHTSTSISLATGLAKGRDLLGEKYNVIALIGDGSLSGGEAFEGLDNASEQNSNLIIIVNDNEMSIAENHGGLYQNLKELRESQGQAKDNFFKSFGFAYYYIEEGNDILKILPVLKEVKDTPHPVVIHVHTVKGKGYRFAEENKEKFHFSIPFDLETGKGLFNFDGENYSEITYQYLDKKMQEDRSVVAITSATPTIAGFNKERREKAGKQLVDVGIAEEHAVAFASGIARAGGTPVYPVYGTFLQRTYDQLSQDLALNKTSVTIPVFATGLYGMNDVTHLGIFDISLLSNIPNLTYLDPTTVEEYIAMLSYSMEKKDGAIAIRIPCQVLHQKEEDTTDYSLKNRSKIVKKGSKVAILAVSHMLPLASEIEQELQGKNIDATIIKPVFLSGIDEELLSSLEKDHQVLITLEDSILDGGYGQKVSSYLASSSIKIKNYGLKKEFIDRFNANELLRNLGIDKEDIVKDILNLF